MQPLIRKVGSADVVEQAAIAGALNPEIIPDREPRHAPPPPTSPSASTCCRRRTNRGWQGTAEDPTAASSFSRRLRGVDHGAMSSTAR